MSGDRDPTADETRTCAKCGQERPLADIVQWFAHKPVRLLCAACREAKIVAEWEATLRRWEPWMAKAARCEQERQERERASKQHRSELLSVALAGAGWPKSCHDIRSHARAGGELSGAQ